MKTNNLKCAYYITKDNDDGSKEIVARINGTLEQAYNQFEKIIKEQQYESQILKSLHHWQVIRLFDTNDNQIKQES